MHKDSSPHSFNIFINGDNSLLVQFDESPNPQLSEFIYELSLAIPNINLKGFSEAVSAYQSILVIFDVTQWSFEDSKVKLAKFINEFKPKTNLKPELIIIPVCYDSRVASDLDSVCSHHGISLNKLIELHTAEKYRVEMLGFLPGFLYLSGLNKKLHTPRKANPALSVPAGSIAIGGNQTGVYATNSPGGWNIIGITPLKTLDLNKVNPAIAKPLDTIQFKSISYQEFLDCEL